MNVRNPWFVAGFLAGCAVGAALAVVLAPAPGAVIAAALRDHFERAKQEAREAGQRTEADVLQRYMTIKNAAAVRPADLAQPGASHP